MKMRWLLAGLAAAAALAPRAAPAQPPPAEVKPIPVVLRPAAEPMPALKYRLAPERRTLEPGNAAVYYFRAILLLNQSRASRPAPPPAAGTTPPESPEQKVARWATAPLAEIPRAEARATLEAYASIFNEVERGARQLGCDWQFDQRNEGITLLLPEIQEMRELARLVAVRARLAVLDGDADEAMRWIRIGLTMGRHTADGPSLIQALVGVAIDSVMAGGIRDLIEAPGAPSLYWALADRPRPMIDMRRPMEGERSLLEQELPDLKELEDGVWGADRARRFADELQRKLFALAGGTPIPGSNGAVPPDLPAFARRMGIAAIAAKMYPEAKQSLIAGGRPADVVERMPIVQVVALDTLRRYNRRRDDVYKWLNQPVWQSSAAIGRAEQPPENKLANPLLALFETLTPALNAARFASVRLERQLDALQVVEAIRLHAHAHGGTLPASLAEISAVPVPLDPATGQPFEYRVEGATATLGGPTPPGMPDHPSYRIHYALTLAPAPAAPSEESR